MSENIKIVIAGGPHAGKTTLFNLLRKRYPEFDYIVEPATKLIKKENKQCARDSSYVGIFPWNNMNKFAHNVMKMSLDMEQKITKKIAILDRSVIDCVAFERARKDITFSSEIIQHIKDAQYSLVFFCDFVGTYEKTEIRSESEQEAINIHDELYHTYEDGSEKFGYEMVIVPGNLSPEERADAVYKKILEFCAQLNAQANLRVTTPRQAV